MVNDAQALDTFLAAIEGRAFYMARLGTHNNADALDIVQETMARFAERYATKAADEWKPLFYRVLQTRIADWHRREFIRSRFFSVFESRKEHTEGQFSETRPEAPDPGGKSAEDLAATNFFMTELKSALANLPHRQRQTFLLRAWEGLSVAETALAMQCSEGTVKTHYSRALAVLKTHLEGHGP